MSEVKSVLWCTTGRSAGLARDGGGGGDQWEGGRDSGDLFRRQVQNARQDPDACPYVSISDFRKKAKTKID